MQVVVKASESGFGDIGAKLSNALKNLDLDVNQDHGIDFEDIKRMHYNLERGIKGLNLHEEWVSLMHTLDADGNGTIFNKLVFS